MQLTSSMVLNCSLLLQPLLAGVALENQLLDVLCVSREATRADSTARDGARHCTREIPDHLDVVSSVE